MFKSNYLIVVLLVVIIAVLTTGCPAKNENTIKSLAREFIASSSELESVSESYSIQVQSENVEEKSRQSQLMLSYTGEAWSSELEEALKDVDFSEYGFDLEKPKLINDINSLFVLANKANYFPEDFVPIGLVAPKSRYAGGGDRNKLRDIAADALDDMVKAAAESSCDIQSVSAYRSIAYQKDLFNYYAQRDGVEKANKYSSKPGYSEHHTGLCVDLSSPSMGFGLDQSYGDTPEGKWLEENAAEYGFVIRYPKDKENITGYTYEPWHLRYLGIPLARYLKQNNLCYEEFLALQLGLEPEKIIID